MEDLDKRYRSYHSVENDLNKLISENNGKFPAYKLLQEHNHGLLDGIVRYHGGINAVMVRMGYPVKKDDYIKISTELEKKGFKRPKKIPYRSLQEPESVISNLKKIIEANDGKFPSVIDLSKMGYSNLARAVNVYHGGFATIRKRMGYESNRKPKTYWENFDHVKSELQEIIETTGHFPRASDLERHYFGLATAIRMYHGGFSDVRKKMGFPAKVRPLGYYEKWENVERELKRVIKENKKDFPNQKELAKMGYSSLLTAIQKYHGGINSAKRKIA